MADNTTLPGTGVLVTGDEVTYSGDTTQAQIVQVAFVTGAEGSRTLTKLPGDGTDGLLVNLGANNDVTVSGTVTANAGTGTQAVSLASLPTLAAGTNNIGDVDVLTMPTVTVNAHDVGSITTAVVPGTAAANLGKAEDAVHTSGDVGVMGLAVRRDADTSLVGTDGDYAPLQVNATGSLKTAITAGVVTTVSTVTNVSQQGGVAIALNTGARAAGVQRVTIATDDIVQTVGSVASDGVDAGNPVKVGFQARTSDATAVASADRVNAISTILGKQIVKLDAVPDLTWSYAAASGGLVNTTAVTVKASAGAGVRNYLKSVQVVNGHATVSTEVLIRDGAAGTVLHRGWAQAAGGGFACTFDPPLRGTAATLLEVVNVTTGSAVYVNASGYVAAE